MMMSEGPEGGASCAASRFGELSHKVDDANKNTNINSDGTAVRPNLMLLNPPAAKRSARTPHAAEAIIFHFADSRKQALSTSYGVGRKNTPGEGLPGSNSANS
jgi:hypothetical protein